MQRLMPAQMEYPDPEKLSDEQIIALKRFVHENRKSFVFRRDFEVNKAGTRVQESKPAAGNILPPPNVPEYNPPRKRGPDEPKSALELEKEAKAEAKRKMRSDKIRSKGP